MDENNQIDPGIANDVLLSDAGNERNEQDEPDDASASHKPHRLPAVPLVLYGIALVSLVIYIAARLSPAFADFFNRFFAFSFRG